MKNDNERTMIGATPVAQTALSTGAAGLEAIVDAWAADVDLDKLAAGLAHVSIEEKRAEQIVAFAKAVFLEGIYRDVLRCEPTVTAHASSNTFEGLADTLLAPRIVDRDREGFFNHPALPACDEDVRIDKLLGAFGLETTFVDLDSDPLSGATKDRMYEAFDFSDWTPTAPNGAGWTLLQIQETENGVYALFARRASKPLHHLHGGRKELNAHLSEVA